METLYLVLFLASAVCFLLSFLNIQLSPKNNIVALGLLFWVMVPFIQVLKAM